MEKLNAEQRITPEMSSMSAVTQSNKQIFHKGTESPRFARELIEEAQLETFPGVSPSVFGITQRWRYLVFSF